MIKGNWELTRGHARLAILTLSALLVFWLLPSIGDWLAERSFANAVPASDPEPPPIAWTPAWSTAELGAFVGRGEGLDCSIPPAALAAFSSKAHATGRALAPVNLRFRQACVAHDLCYRHGRATYGYTQAQCDAALASAAFRLCRSFPEYRPASVEGISPEERREAVRTSLRQCVTEARKVLAGVTLGGTGSFRPATSDARLPGARRVPVERGSTIAEYEAYPQDAAEFTLPRIGRGTCSGQANAPLLVTISRRGGGFHVNRRCFDGTSFVPLSTVAPRTRAQASRQTEPRGRMPRKAVPTLAPPARPAPSPAAVRDPAAEAAEDAPSDVGSEYRYDVSMPWLTATGGLVRRCRNSLQHTTGGSFVSYPDPARYAGCRPGGRATDPDVVTMVPVPGELSDRIPAIGIKTSIIRHIDADGTLDAVGRQGDIGCMHGARGGSCATPIPPTCPGDDAGAFYRWSALPPALAELPPDGARGPLVAATIFARGCRDESDYQTLKSATALLDGRGWVPRSRGGVFGPLVSWRVPETAEPVLSVGIGLAHRLVSLHAVPFPHLRLWLKAGNIALALGCACVLVTLLLSLRLTRRGLGWGIVSASLAALLLGFHSVADRIVGDGFTQDAELSIYPPKAGAPEVRMLLNGRAWLQQRTPVVADGDRALILMPKYVRTANCRGDGLALDVWIASFTAVGRGDAWHAAASNPLPCGARGWDPSTTFLVPFRTATGRLDVLVMGMDGNQAVFASTSEDGARQFGFRLVPSETKRAPTRI